MLPWAPWLLWPCPGVVQILLNPVLAVAESQQPAGVQRSPASKLVSAWPGLRTLSAGELAAQALVMDGPQSVIVDSVPPRQAVTVPLQLVALTPGQTPWPSIAGSIVRTGQGGPGAYDT